MTDLTIQNLEPKSDDKTATASLGYQADIVVGGSDPKKFVPNINCSFRRKFLDEFFLNINADDVLVSDEKETIEENNAEIKVGDRTDKYFVDDNDCLEYQIILDSKTVSNEITLKIECSPVLKFVHQQQFSTEEQSEGWILDPDIENSYAIYCDKANNE